MGEIWREHPVMGSYPDPRVLAHPGLRQLEIFLDQLGPRPPIHYLTGMRPTEVAAETATFTMPATEWLQAPPGSLYPGMLAILADGPLGSAVQVALPPMTVYTTAEMSLSYVRPTPVDGRDITARARTVLVGSTLGLADCVIEDADGRIIATGSTRCFIFPPFGPPPDEMPELESWTEPAFEQAPPYRRPVAGEILGQDVWDSASGLDILLGHAKGELPRPPYHHLTGIRPTEGEEGACTFVLPATEWLNAPTGKPIGGATAMLADSAIQAAVQTTVPPGTAYAPLDLKVSFLRPVEADGRDLTARGTVQHRGRTMAVATAAVTNADGKKVAIATGSSLILPGRPWRANRPVDASEEATA